MGNNIGWSRIRQAEDVGLLADGQRASAAPETPLGANAIAEPGLLFRRNTGAVALCGWVVPTSPGCVDENFLPGRRPGHIGSFAGRS